MKKTTVIALACCWMGMAACCSAAETAEGLLTEAQQAEQSGASQKAAKLYEQFLQQHADHSQVTFARYGLAKCYDAMGLVEESNAEFKKVLEGSPQFSNRRDAFYALGKSYGSNKMYEEGVAVFTKMLAEGAGLYEDEVLTLCSSYYAALGKYDDAAGMLNRLKRRQGSPLAEQAAQKQVAMYINAGKALMALNSLNELIQLYPKCKEIPNFMGRVADLYLTQKQYPQAVQLCNKIIESYPNDPAAPQLMLRIGDAYRGDGQFDKAIALCDQVKNTYPATIEALTASFLIGLCQRDRKDFQKAVAALDQIGKIKEYRVNARMKGLAAEALMQSAEICFAELNDAPKAMERYADAAALARESDSDRKNAILERCYFRLADDAFQKRQWGAALDYYLMLKALGTQLDILGRILECNNQLNTLDAESLGRNISPFDLSNLEARVKSNAGTATGLDLELFLLDRKYNALIQKLGAGACLAAADRYQALLTNYPPAVLAEYNNLAYIYLQIGQFCSAGTNESDVKRAQEAFDKAVQSDPSPSNPWKISALEGKAILASRCGDTNTTAKASLELFEIAVGQLTTNTADLAQQKKAIDYLKTLASRSEGNMIDEAIKVCQKTIEKHGTFSDLAREARFNMAQLYYQKRDFSAAAATFKEQIAAYGPKQDANGDFVEPWKPVQVDEKVLQLYDAALKIAHSWYLQGHQQNMLKAYRWMVRNMPYQNNHLAEAQYWLALDAVPAAERDTEAGKLKLAETLWTRVVNSNLDLASPKLKSSYYPWISHSRYIKPALLKIARCYHESGKHESAALVLEQYLELFGKTPKLRDARDYSEMDEVALYALGREYVETRDMSKMIQIYQFYLNNLRDSPLRVSALNMLAYHAGQQGAYPVAVETYGALLDEYGTNAVDAQGGVLRVPAAERIRTGNTGWDGVRLPPPKTLDQGETRFALGFLYWKQNDWASCVRVLRPFAEDGALSGMKSRDKALSMLGQSYFKMADYAPAAKTLTILIYHYPKFEGLDDAYYFAARSWAELAAWADLEKIYGKYVADMGDSSRRPRMELLGARLAIGKGDANKGRANLKSLASGDASEDVRAEAYYYLGQECLARKPPQWQEAADMFAKSLAVFPHEQVCVAGAKAYMALKDWPKALALLERAVRDFPGGDAKVIAEARALMPQVLKESAKVGSTK